MDLDTLLGKTLAAKVVVKDASGRRREISKLEAALTQLVNKAAGGADPRATRLVLDLLAKRQAREARADGTGFGDGGPPATGPAPDLPIDWAAMSTDELRVAAEFMRVIDRHLEPPGPADCPMPPAGPGGGEGPDGGDAPLRWYTPSPGYPPDDGEGSG